MDLPPSPPSQLDSSSEAQKLQGEGLSPVEVKSRGLWGDQRPSRICHWFARFQGALVFRMQSFTVLTDVDPSSLLLKDSNGPEFLLYQARLWPPLSLGAAPSLTVSCLLHLSDPVSPFLPAGGVGLAVRPQGQAPGLVGFRDAFLSPGPIPQTPKCAASLLALPQHSGSCARGAKCLAPMAAHLLVSPISSDCL